MTADRPVDSALSAAQDEIERRISECESHRAVVDAVLAEREAERQLKEWRKALPVFTAANRYLLLNHTLRRAAEDHIAECAAHRRAVVDSIGGA